MKYEWRLACVLVISLFKHCTVRPYWTIISVRFIPGQRWRSNTAAAWTDWLLVFLTAFPVFGVKIHDLILGKKKILEQISSWSSRHNFLHPDKATSEYVLLIRSWLRNSIGIIKRFFEGWMNLSSHLPPSNDWIISEYTFSRSVMMGPVT